MREKALVISSTEILRTYFLALFDLSRNRSHISAERLSDLKSLRQVKPKISISLSKGEHLVNKTSPPISSIMLMSNGLRTPGGTEYKINCQRNGNSTRQFCD